MGRDFSFAFAFAFVFALVLLLLLAAPAQAVMLEISLDELAQKADCVIIGTVLERTSKWNDDHTHIYTTVVVNVEESLKGAVKPGNVSIIVQGGRVGKDFMMVSDTPGFEVGEKAVLFLENLSQPRVSEMRMTQLQADAPVFQVYGYFQGKLDVKDNKVCNVAVSEFKSQLIDSLATGEKMTIGEGGKSKPELVTRDEVSPADNYVYNGKHWPINNPTTVTYKIHSSFSPDARTAVQSAATTWSNAGAKFAFSYSGTHNQTPAFENHVNEISRESWGINGTLAQASISGHGDIVDECDMVFNSSYSWCESGTPADWQKDLESVALHEFGHFLVLDHSPNINSVMFWQVNSTRRSLDPDDDIPGIKAIYGKWLVPPTVATSGHRELTDTSVRLLGDLSSVGSASSAVVSFMYGTTTACSGGSSSTKTFTGYIYSPVNFGIPISGLSPNTIYYYKAKAAGDGTGYGNILSFTTTGGPTVATSGNRQLTDTSVRLLGDLTSLGSASSAVVSFMYGTTTACSGGSSSTKTFTAPSSFGTPISGLSPGTTYFYKAKVAGNGTGNGISYGNILHFTTTGGPAGSPTVTTSGYRQLTDTSIRLLGDLTSLGSASSVDSYFMYDTTEACSYNFSSVKTFAAPASFGIPLSGLSPNTTYYYRAVAEGSSAGYGSVLSFTTTGGTPPTVTTSGNRQLTDTSVRLLGDLTSLGSASSVVVSFMYGPTTACSGGSASTKTFTAPSSFGTPISGLSPNTTYYYKAKAVGDGTSYGTVLSFTTTGGTPPSVTTSGYRQLTSTSVRLLGDLTSLGSVSSVVVSFMYGPTTACSGGSSSTKTFTAPTSFGTPISGLSPGTTYYYKAKAVGNGTSYGSVLSFTTIN